jgi:hypothetical protein
MDWFPFSARDRCTQTEDRYESIPRAVVVPTDFENLADDVASPEHGNAVGHTQVRKNR